MKEKKKMLLAGALAVCIVFCIGLPVFLRQQRNTEEVTRQLAALFDEGYEWRCGYDSAYSPQRVSEEAESFFMRQFR